MALTQANVMTIHTLLVDYAWNALSGAPARKADLDALCLDIKTDCLDGRWDALDLIYRGVWFGEISRRVTRIVPDATAVIRKRTSGDITQEKLLDTVTADGAQILTLKFSQFTINRHFSDEVARLGRSFADTGRNLGASIPESRRSRQDWDAMTPSSATAVPETRNSTRVIYTIKAISMSPGAAPDHGNEQVMNSAL